MDAASVGLSALATAAILGSIPLIAILQRAISSGGRIEWARLTAIGAIGVLVGGVTVLASGGLIAPLLSAPVVALGGLFASLATSARAGVAIWKPLLFAVAATTIVFVPTALAVFGPPFDPFANRLGVLDLGGALPSLVAGAATAIGAGRVARGSFGFVGGPKFVGGLKFVGALKGGARILLPAVGLLLVSIAWLVGFELAIDEFTVPIAVNALLMPAAAAAASSLVERLRHRRNSASGLVVGGMAGMAAAVSACAFLTPPLAIVVALIAGAVAATVPSRPKSPSLTAVPGALLLGAATSVVLLGLLATNVGFIYTGQPELIFGQAFIALVSVLGGLVVGAVLGRALKF